MKHSSIQIIRKDGSKGYPFPISNKISIGNSQENEIRIQLINVLPLHCVIDGNKLVAFGDTWVNGVKLSEKNEKGEVEKVLDNGDVFCVGLNGREFLFNCDKGEADKGESDLDGSSVVANNGRDAAVKSQDADTKPDLSSSASVSEIKNEDQPITKEASDIPAPPVYAEPVIGIKPCDFVPVVDGEVTMTPRKAQTPLPNEHNTPDTSKLLFSPIKSPRPRNTVNKVMSCLDVPKADLNEAKEVLNFESSDVKNASDFGEFQEAVKKQETPAQKNVRDELVGDVVNQVRGDDLSCLKMLFKTPIKEEPVPTRTRIVKRETMAPVAINKIKDEGRTRRSVAAVQYKDPSIKKTSTRKSVVNASGDDRSSVTSFVPASQTEKEDTKEDDPVVPFKSPNREAEPKEKDDMFSEPFPLLDVNNNDFAEILDDFVQGRDSSPTEEVSKPVKDLIDYEKRREFLNAALNPKAIPKDAKRKTVNVFKEKYSTKSERRRPSAPIEALISKHFAPPIKKDTPVEQKSSSPMNVVEEKKAHQGQGLREEIKNEVRAALTTSVPVHREMKRQTLNPLKAQILLEAEKRHSMMVDKVIRNTALHTKPVSSKKQTPSKIEPEVINAEQSPVAPTTLSVDKLKLFNADELKPKLKEFRRLMRTPKRLSMVEKLDSLKKDDLRRGDSLGGKGLVSLVNIRQEINEPDMLDTEFSGPNFEGVFDGDVVSSTKKLQQSREEEIDVFNGGVFENEEQRDSLDDLAFGEKSEKKIKRKGTPGKSSKPEPQQEYIKVESEVEVQSSVRIRKESLIDKDNAESDVPVHTKVAVEGTLQIDQKTSEAPSTKKTRKRAKESESESVVEAKKLKSKRGVKKSAKEAEVVIAPSDTDHGTEISDRPRRTRRRAVDTTDTESVVKIDKKKKSVKESKKEDIKETKFVYSKKGKIKFVLEEPTEDLPPKRNRKLVSESETEVSTVGKRRGRGKKLEESEEQVSKSKDIIEEEDVPKSRKNRKKEQSKENEEIKKNRNTEIDNDSLIGRKKRGKKVEDVSDVGNSKKSKAKMIDENELIVKKTTKGKKDNESLTEEEKTKTSKKLSEKERKKKEKELEKLKTEIKILEKQIKRKSEDAPALRKRRK